jgi:hypothetical protein
MSITSSSPSRRRSRRAALLAGLALAVLGPAAFASSAGAHFVLSSGTLDLVQGGASGNPPSGSWVTLPSDDGGGAYFTNPSSTWTGTPDGLYTRISNGTAGFTLGAAQPAGGIIGASTDTFAGLPWTLVNTGASTLTFDGADNAIGTRTLTRANLTGLKVTYNGATYNVGTTTGGGNDVITALTGSITGNATSTTSPAQITLDWTTDLTEVPFNTFQAHFHLVANYTP